jgi:hypothetical protein
LNENGGNGNPERAALAQTCAIVALRRALLVYTRVGPDLVTAAFVEAIYNDLLTNPPRVQKLLSN